VKHFCRFVRAYLHRRRWRERRVDAARDAFEFARRMRRHDIEVKSRWP
jgi:hypothetical protein